MHSYWPLNRAQMPILLLHFIVDKKKKWVCRKSSKKKEQISLPAAQETDYEWKKYSCRYKRQK